MPATSWIAHVKAVYQKNKSKGMSYKDALKTAAKSWKKKKGAAPKAAKATAPKKRRRKAKADEPLDEEPEEEKTAKKPKRKRMRPGVAANEKNIN